MRVVTLVGPTSVNPILNDRTHNFLRTPHWLDILQFSTNHGGFIKPLSELGLKCTDTARLVDAGEQPVLFVQSRRLCRDPGLVPGQLIDQFARSMIRIPPAPD